MKVKDYVFEYIERGKGESVVFVHGSVSDYRTWQKQQDEFSKLYHTISYSRRFHWPNKPIADHEEYSMNQHVEDLEELLKGLNKPVHLIGHSYGAFICLLLAIKSPQLIRSLVLSEPPIITLYVSNSPKPLELLKLLISRPQTAIALIKLGATGMDPATKEIKRGNIKKAIEIFGKATLGVKTYENLSDERIEQVNQNVIKSEFIGSGFPPLDSSRIQSIKIPTLLISGENSPKIFQLLLERLKELMPHATLKSIEAASHISHEDNSIVYNKLVLSFIGQISFGQKSTN